VEAYALGIWYSDVFGVTPQLSAFWNDLEHFKPCFFLKSLFQNDRGLDLPIARAQVAQGSRDHPQGLIPSAQTGLKEWPSNVDLFGWQLCHCGHARIEKRKFATW
jgi:hypothetical protein